MSQDVIDIITLWAPPVILILSVVNSLTKHYTRFNGILRIVLQVVERLSFLASKQTGKRVKLVGKSIKPDPILERLADVEEQFKRMAKIKKASGNSLVRRR